MTTDQTTGIRAIVFGQTRKLSEQVWLGRALPYWKDLDVPPDYVIGFDGTKPIQLINYRLVHYPFLGHVLHVYVTDDHVDIASSYINRVYAYAQELPSDFRANPNVYWLAEGLMYAHYDFMFRLSEYAIKHTIKHKLH